MQQAGNPPNPFAVTKADDYDDAQIQEFWVDAPTTSDSYESVIAPTVPMPVYLLGAKGSGKTHIMRYHSFRLQRLRYEQKQIGLDAGLQEDGYLGLYVRCSGLNSGRFSGKRQPPEKWSIIFAYYMELWLGLQTLEIIGELAVGSEEGDATRFVADVLMLLDIAIDCPPTTIKGLTELIDGERRKLDFEINNCLLSGGLEVSVKASPGKLVFGIPRTAAVHFSSCGQIAFAYLIDEVETLSLDQQKFLNSLIRDREAPSTFRIGARLYGLKTTKTWSDDEEIIPDSEFVKLELDQHLRSDRRKYRSFSGKLLAKRMMTLGYDEELGGRILREAFEQQNQSWSSPLYLEMVKGVDSQKRRHFVRLERKLKVARVPETEAIVDALSVFDYPLVEKAGVLSFYRRFSKGQRVHELAAEIGQECREFVSSGGKKGDGGGIQTIVDHYRTDLSAQLRRENRVRHVYLGLDSFIMMSGGLPRALLTILRRVFEWALYNGETPAERGGISVNSQYRGVVEASEWFYSSMRKSDGDGLVVHGAVERLAELFRENQFADRVIECSLNNFSVRLQGMRPEARQALAVCEQRSFIVRVSGGRKEKNSKELQMRYQLHPLLCPRWQLPIGRRGSIELGGGLADAVFAPKNDEEYEGWLRRFRSDRSFSAPRTEEELF